MKTKKFFLGSVELKNLRVRAEAFESILKKYYRTAEYLHILNQHNGTSYSTIYSAIVDHAPKGVKGSDFFVRNRTLDRWACRALKIADRDIEVWANIVKDSIIKEVELRHSGLLQFNACPGKNLKVKK